MNPAPPVTSTTLGAAADAPDSDLVAGGSSNGKNVLLPVRGKGLDGDESGAPGTPCFTNGDGCGADGGWVDDDDDDDDDGGRGGVPMLAIVGERAAPVTRRRGF